MRGVILGGNSNEIDAAAVNSATIGGNGLLVNGNNQLAIGSYNFPRNNMKFVVGDGTGDGDKSNSFEIYNNGKVRILSNNLEIGDKSNQIPSTPLNITGLKNTSVITLASTNNDSNWVQGDKIGGINFYSADASGSGPGVFGSINYVTTTNSASGGITGMTFNVADSITKNVERMRICDSGNVGIGTATTSTTNPADKLHVIGTIRAEVTAASGLAFNAINSLGSGSSGISFDNNNGELNLKNSSNVSNVKLSTNGFPSYFRGGRVGIGTTSPASKLQVNGGDIEVDDSASGLILKSPDGTRYRVTVDNVGALSASAV